MRKNVLFIITLAFSLSVLAAESEKTPLETGRFILSYRGEQVGFEKYVLFKQDDGLLHLEVNSQVVLPKGSGNISFEFKVSEVLDNNYNPVLFDENYRFENKENYLHAKFENGKAIDEALMDGQLYGRTTHIQSPFCIIEEAVYTQYYFVYKKYTPINKGQKLSFTAYIPKIAKDLKAYITYNDDNQVQTPFGQMKLRQYVVDIGSFQSVIMLINEKGQLMEMTLPKQEMQVSRDLTFDMQQATKPLTPK